MESEVDAELLVEKEQTIAELREMVVRSGPASFNSKVPRFPPTDLRDQAIVFVATAEMLWPRFGRFDTVRVNSRKLCHGHGLILFLVMVCLPLSGHPMLGMVLPLRRSFGA